jgi:hypothetical protein
MSLFARSKEHQLNAHVWSPTTTDWRVQESARIQKAGYSEAARLTALADLLDQESALIQKIDRLKIAANEENYERGVLKLLEAVRGLVVWHGFAME